ncbi:type VI secretion system baseplate subunit TssF [Chitinimonas koreensis]|uniref:type VI secretion system baseplate subunit TssF n=1 Tax=Chitinimonas koreensis TaxID=356302 RepID=UPI000427AEDC|nr:type VI secretion system baseplate subunit TssF [Chitinimonas koreensis]QNM95347.1 type VI secretion system baseplate subunit TssF [Chitinimonas koreensis]
MQTASEFRDYFEAELAQLREQAVEFGRDYPAAAQALALGQGRSGDPQVELMMQSFAFLTGRLRHQLDRDAALLPNALMAQLYPHLEAPIPSLTVAELTLRPDGANFATGAWLERGREFHAVAQDDDGRDVRCRLRTCFETPLVPLRVVELGLVSTTAYDLDDDPAVHSVLKLRLRGIGTEPLSALSMPVVRFYLDIENTQVWRLYELLALNLAGVATLPVGSSRPRRLGADALRWLGFEEHEAALETDLVTHPGYRLVQEYFAFPEKFLFFELSGLDFSDLGEEAELLFLLTSAVDKTLDPGPNAMRLNCVPLINLFPQRIEPLALDHTQHEYRLSGDHAHHSHTEIYRVDSLYAVRPGEPARPVAPYFALDDFGLIERQDYFYVTRRVESVLRSVPGTETYVSFLDLAFDTLRPADETIGGRALCTNRRLAEQLRLGDKLRLEGPGPVRDARVAAKPTPHQSPVLIGGQPWALISQLLLNHLSLTGGAQAMNALKSMLGLHLGRASMVGPKQIDSLSGLEARPVVKDLYRDGRYVPVEGLAITLRIDRLRFEGGSPILFAEVLRRFFALYASVNTLIELSLETHDVKGRLKTWPPMVGAQIVL